MDFMVSSRIFYSSCFGLAFITSVRAELCFTANTTESELQLLCRVETFDFPLTIRDPSGLDVVVCVNDSSSPICKSLQPYNKVSHNFDEKTVSLTIKRNKGSILNGKWVCKNGGNIKEKHISLVEGMITSTEVRIRGEVVNTDGKKRISISCSTCQTPKGEIVEFLLNKTTFDFVRFVSISQCYHKTGVCRPQDCRCSVRGNRFTRIFDNPTNPRSETNYTCVMHFSDTLLQKDFTILSSLQFTNGNFRQGQTQKLVTREEDRISGIYTTRPSGTPLKTTTHHFENNKTKANWGFTAIAVVVPVMMLCVILVCIKMSQDRQKSTGIKTEDNTTDALAPLAANDEAGKRYDQAFPEVTGQQTGNENLIKLNQLITKIGLKIGKDFFKNKVLHNTDLTSLLKQNKHFLFHGLHPKRRCCHCLKEEIEIDIAVLLKLHFSNLYILSDKISCEFDDKNECVCKFIPKQTISVDTLDMSTLIGLLSALPRKVTTKHEFINIRAFCNELVPFIGNGIVPNDHFKIISEKLKTFLSSFANDEVGSKESLDKEIQRLEEKSTVKTADEFKDILALLQHDQRLLMRQQAEMRFQKAAQKFEPFSFHEIKVYKLDQHAEVEIIDFSNIPLHNYANGDEAVREVLIKLSLPHPLDLDVILTHFSDMKEGGRIKIVEKSLEDLIFVANISLELFDSKDLFKNELLEMIKNIIRISSIDLSPPAKLLVGVEPAPIAKMYVQRSTTRLINSCALLSEDEVVYTDNHNKVCVIYNFKTKVRHSHDLPDIPFDMAVISIQEIAISFPNLMEIHLYSLTNCMFKYKNVHRIGEKGLFVGKRDKGGLYIFIEERGLCVLNSRDQCPTFETSLPFFDPYKDAVTFGKRDFCGVNKIIKRTKP